MNHVTYFESCVTSVGIYNSIFTTLKNENSEIKKRIYYEKN